jgi:hypothetical protein
MPIFHVNFDTKPGSNSLANLSKNGDELVKAMKLLDRSNSQQGSGGNATSTNSSGSAQGSDAFAKQIVNIQSKIEGLNESERQLSEGKKLLDAVEKMITDSKVGILKKIRNMKELWLSMTQTGRELNNSDLHKIHQIKKDIKNILEQFASLRYNGVSVFSRKVNIQNSKSKLSFSNTNSANRSNNNFSSNFTTTGNSGANIDFVRQYEDIRQNLSFVQENVTSYIQKSNVTRNLENAERGAIAIISQSNSQKSNFSSLANSVFYSKRRTRNQRDQVIRERQNQMSVEAVVNILERQ